MLLVLFSCKKNNLEIINLNNNKIGALGHGGMGIAHTYPMNSFESIQNCLSLGADGTELDVQMTKDSVLVAFHDEWLERVSNTSGQIFNKTWAEIKDAYYTIPLYANYKLVTLEEIFANIKNPQAYTFFLDCKNYKPDTSALYLNTFNNALLKIIDKYQLENNAYIVFKRRDLIKNLKTKQANVKIFAYGDFDYALATVNEFQLEGITNAVDKISKENVITAHNNGTMVAVFNAHSKKKNKEAIEKNVDFIQSDRIRQLCKLLK